MLSRSRWSAAGSLPDLGKIKTSLRRKKPNAVCRTPPASRWSPRGHKNPPERSLQPTSSQSPFRLILD